MPDALVAPLGAFRLEATELLSREMTIMIFRNRREAGRQLAAQLLYLKHEKC